MPFFIPFGYLAPTHVCYLALTTQTVEFMNQESQEFWEEFASEAREHLASAGSDLLALEKDPADGAKARIDRVFRGMHSIKGGAAFLGLVAVEKLSHSLESLLDLVRKGKCEPRPDLIDLSLRGTDKLQALLDDLGHSDPEQIQDMVLEITNMVNEISKPGTKSPTPKQTKNKSEKSTEKASEKNPESTPSEPQSSPGEEASAHHTETPMDSQIGTSIDPARNSTVRIGVELLDRLMNLAGELVLVRNQALQLAGNNKSRNLLGENELRPVVSKLNALTSEIQQTVLQTRLQPLGNIFSRFPRMVRNLARDLDKEISLEIEGSEVEMDKAILDLLTDPLTHLVRNSCDHGIESPRERTKVGKPSMGRMILRAIPEGGMIRIELRDDGRGIDPVKVREKALKTGVKTAAELDAMTVQEIQSLVFAPGFSTAATVTDLSGRGVGLDVVRSNVELIGGILTLSSQPGFGTQLSLRLPLTVAILPSMLVGIGEQQFALLQRDIVELICLENGAASTGGSGACLSQAHDREVLLLRGAVLPVLRLASVLGLGGTDSHKGRLFAVVVRSARGPFCLLLERIASPAEIVVKRLPRVLRYLGAYSGATITGDGQTALILDAEGLARMGDLRITRDSGKPLSSISQIIQKDTINEGLILRRLDEYYFLPMEHAQKLVPFAGGRMESIEDKRYFFCNEQRHEMLELIPGNPIASQDHPTGLAILLRFASAPKAIGVDECLDCAKIKGEIRPLGESGGKIRGTLNWQGKILRVLDILEADAENGIPATRSGK